MVTISGLVVTAIHTTALNLSVVTTSLSAPTVTETATETVLAVVLIESDRAQMKTDMIHNRIILASDCSYIIVPRLLRVT